MVHYVRRDDIAIREHEMRVERGVCGAAEPARFSIRTDMVTCPKCLAILGDDSLTDDPALE